MRIYKIDVSSIEVRKDVSKSSRVHLTRDTIVKATDASQKQHNHQRWIEIETVNEPTVRGYVQLKYLSYL